MKSSLNHNARAGSGPLAGKVVIELGHSVAAPYAGQILGDLGAEIIKIEKPGGDDARKWGPPFFDGAAATFQALNRNKKSVVANLRHDPDRKALIDLIVNRADVVLQNLRPGQLEDLGLGPGDLLALKPSLVYCNMGAFGARGPLATQPGYDPLMQAFGGIMSVVGEEGRSSVRVGPSIIDMGTGMWAAMGITAALLRRQETGEGSVVDVSLFETATAWMTMHAAGYMASSEVPRKAGSGQMGIVPYRAYQTADGELVVAAGNDGLFRKLCGVLEHPEWADDARFAGNPDRVKNSAALYALIEPEMLTLGNAQWTRRLEGAGIPCAPVQDVRQMLAHPQTHAMGMVQSVPGASIPLIGLPISFDGIRPASRSASPALGADNQSVFPLERISE